MTDPAAAAPLTPEEEHEWRELAHNTSEDRIWAILDAARARIAELERGLEQMSQSIIHSQQTRAQWGHGWEYTSLDDARKRIDELEVIAAQHVLHAESADRWKKRAETAELDRDAAEQLKSSVIQRIVRERDEARANCAAAIGVKDKLEHEVERLKAELAGKNKFVTEAIATCNEVGLKLRAMRPVVEAAEWVRDHQYGEHAANYEQLLKAIRDAVDAYRAQVPVLGQPQTRRSSEAVR